MHRASLAATSSFGLLLALLSACSTSVDMHGTILTPGSAHFSRIGVAVFDNLSGNPAAGSAVAAAIVNELRHRRAFQVVEIDPAPPGVGERWTASRAGKEAKVEAVLVGVVTSYDYSRVSTRAGQTVSPAISVDLRLVSSNGAEIVWAAGVGAKLVPVFSAEGMPLEQLAQAVAERVVEILAKMGTQG